jgi:hypothetical protein
MSEALVSLLVVSSVLSTFLRLGSETAVVPTTTECRLISGRGTAAVVAVPGAGSGSSVAGARSPGAVATVVDLGVECFHLSSEIFDLLPKGAILGKRCNACEQRLGCSLLDAVCATGCSVKVDLRLSSEDDPYKGV